MRLNVKKKNYRTKKASVFNFFFLSALIDTVAIQEMARERWGVTNCHLALEPRALLTLNPTLLCLLQLICKKLQKHCNPSNS